MAVVIQWNVMIDIRGAIKMAVGRPRLRLRRRPQIVAQGRGTMFFIDNTTWNSFLINIRFSGILSIHINQEISCKSLIK